VANGAREATHLRLTDAILFLRKGGVLAKYRAGHIIGERHNRFVQLSPDLTTLHWGGVDKATAGVAASDATAGAPEASSFDEDDKNVKSLRMDDVTAVTDGAKTGLMKTMKERELKSVAKPDKVLHKVAPSLRPKELALECAFSIISKERSYDFVAADRAGRDAWLSHLQMLLINRATHDTQKMMSRGEVVEEMRALSFRISKLSKKLMSAKVELSRSVSVLKQESRLSTLAEE